MRCLDRGHGEAGLRRQSRNARVEIWSDAALFLAFVVIDIPRDLAAWLKDQNGGLAFEAVEILGLVSSIDQPILRRKLTVEVVIGAYSHVIERQEIKVVRPRIVELVFCVIALCTERA